MRNFTIEQVNLNGNLVDYEACINLMDDEIREELHMRISPCQAQDFINAYTEAHYKKYQEEFTI